MDINIEAASRQLLHRANVVGVGIGFKRRGGKLVLDASGQPIRCIVVSVTEKVPVSELAAADMVPAEIDDQPTDVVATGPISIISDLEANPKAAAVNPQTRIRPIIGGLSIGLNPGVTAGTLGIIVRRPGDANAFILSNWHVMAGNNTPIADRTVLTVTQPGNFDGGRVPDDVVALLADFVPITSGNGGGGGVPSPCPTAAAVAWLPNFLAELVGSDTRLVPMKTAGRGITPAAETNLVDAALAHITVEFSPEIAQIGVVRGQATGELGMRVQKFGRTTSYTVGTITQVNATFVVQGYPDGPATFTDQLAITADSGPFLQGGDSGSALISMDNQATGLCFAGSNVIGIANRWEHVASGLNIVPA